MNKLFGLTQTDRNRLKYISDHFPRNLSAGVGANRHRANTEIEAVPSESSGYSGEFKVSVGEIQREEKPPADEIPDGDETEKEETPGEIISLELFIRNGLFDGAVEYPSYAGWITLAGKRIAKTAAYHGTFSQDGEYDISNLYIWHETFFHPVDGIRSTFVFTSDDEMPEDKTGINTVVYHLLAVIRDGQVCQAHYGPINITDRYYDDTVTE